MLEIKNLLFQPLTLHLVDSTKSVHLGSRGKVTVKEKDLSQEIKRAQTRGWISVKTINEKSESTTKKKREDKS